MRTAATMMVMARSYIMMVVVVRFEGGEREDFWMV